MGAKVPVTISMDEDLLREVDVVAQSVGMSRSAFISAIVRAVQTGDALGFLKLAYKGALTAKVGDVSTSGFVVE